ncbi:MAG: restriction endonuclease [Tannerellaceae bacterium]|jgi:restriction system protein|nr:restriction endonuclease [Tannerellaceae bacterium]
MGKNKTKSKVPTFDKLLNPTLEALKLLGGSGSIEEINETVYRIANLDEETLSIPHKDDGMQSAIDYRLAWARTYLKKYGLIENSSRGVWALVDNEIDLNSYNPNHIVKAVREENHNPEKDNIAQTKSLDPSIEDGADELDWKEQLLNVIQGIDASAFERLSQRILRESGFIQVEVIGKSGDGGIDGKGIVRLNGFLSFHVFFQCKRFKNSVASSYIRDFRGAMQGRADKGLFITTGKFTRDAMKEASRDGAPPIDLIDGDLLCEKLKEFSLGVKTELIEAVTINPEWFAKI